MLGIFFLLLNGVRHLIDQRKNPAFTSLQCIESSAPRMDDQVVFKRLAQESYPRLPEPARMRPVRRKPR